MKITRTSGLTGQVNTKDIDVTPQQLEEWKSGGLIQNIMPDLSADDREFLMTGITAEEWDKFVTPKPVD